MASGGGASELPLWSSSSNISGIVNPCNNIELNNVSDPLDNITFPEMPIEDLVNDNGLAELTCNNLEVATTSDTPVTLNSLSDENNDKEEVSSTVSNLSDLSGISMLSEDGDDECGEECKDPATWVQSQIQMGKDPRDVLRILFSDPSRIPQVDDFTLWKIVMNIMSEPPRRQKLTHVNTVKDVVELIKNSSNVIVLTGAGVSVSCGIPDFRSRDGIYSRLAQDFPDLPDPQAMFDINYFSQDPRPFYKFAREIYPGQFEPSPCHKFIKMLESQNKLLRNYSQNIDTLERVAGIKNLIECHGSFATASCTKCDYQVQSDDIKDDILAQNIPMCPKCQQQSLPSLADSSSNDNYKNLVMQGVMKPDIVFFGEGLPDAFHDAMSKDKRACDLLIVIGSSLKVRPVALIPSSIPASVPQILINRESLSHYEFDVELLGDGDVIINQICHMLKGDFKTVCWQDTVLEETSQLISSESLWKESEKESSKHDTSQESTESKQYSKQTPTKRDSSELNENDEQEDKCALDDRPWKKMRGDVGPKELYEDEQNSQITCTKFYSKIAEYYDKKSSVTCDSDSECLSDSNLDNKTENKSERSQNVEESEEGNRESSIGLRDLNFYSEFSENRVKSFSLIDKNHIEERHLNSCENSPNSTRKSMTLSSGESPTTSYESLRTTEEIFISDDSHVVPRIDYLRDESILDGNLGPMKSDDKFESNPRHTSIDSVMDSALGDSCSSSDCQKVKSDIDNSEDNKQTHQDEDNLSWPIKRNSLAFRLPENSYYQLKAGKYIFPGAEVYSNFAWREEVVQVSRCRSANDH